MIPLIIALLGLTLVSSVYLAKKYVDLYIPVDTDGTVVVSWDYPKLIGLSVFLVSLPLFIFGLNQDPWFNVFTAFLISLLAVIDVQSKIIPTKLVYPFTLISFLLAVFTTTSGTFIIVLMTSLIFYFIMFIVHMVGPMGFGDVRYSLLLGSMIGVNMYDGSTTLVESALYGVVNIMYVLLASSVLFVLQGLFVATFYNKEFRKLELPYGPVLAVSTFLVSFNLLGIL